MAGKPGRIEAHERASEARGLVGFLVGGALGLFTSLFLSENGQDIWNNPARIFGIVIVALITASLGAFLAHRTGQRVFPVVGSEK